LEELPDRSDAIDAPKIEEEIRDACLLEKLPLEPLVEIIETGTKSGRVPWPTIEITEEGR